MRQRYYRPQNSDHARANDERRKLDETRLCLRHDTHYRTHRRMGSVVVRTVGCQTCQDERLAEWKAIDEAEKAARAAKRATQS